MKKKIIIVTLILLVLGICFYFKENVEEIKHHVYPISSEIKPEDETEDNKIEELLEENIIEEDIKEEAKVVEEMEEEKKASTFKEEPIKNNTNKVSSSSNNTPKNNTPSNSNSNNNGTVNSGGNVKQEEKPVVVQKKPWEELGLTEDQYKNQPMYSWEEVDFNTKEECMNYGNEHAEYGFECSEVTSWTRSLGWDYKTF